MPQIKIITWTGIPIQRRWLRIICCFLGHKFKGSTPSRTCKCCNLGHPTDMPILIKRQKAEIELHVSDVNKVYEAFK